MLDYKKALAYFRDQFVPFEQANLSIASSPVLYGLSVYTVFGANWSEDHKQLYVFRIRDHYDRLINSAKILGFADFEVLYSFEDFRGAAMELLRRNDVHEDALVRVTVFIDELIAGTKINGLKNSMSMYVYPMGEILPRTGISACVSSWQRLADNMIPARAKVNGSYVNASLMKNEALLNGYDEAIALDGSGHVAEGTVANLFLVRGGRLITPGQDTDILEGITRDSILKIADSMKLPHEERKVDRTELYIADEVFMVGSSARVTAVTSIDKRQVGDGKVGPMAGQLSDEYHAIQIGERRQYSDWLTAVYSS